MLSELRPPQAELFVDLAQGRRPEGLVQPGPKVAVRKEIRKWSRGVGACQC
jgi:hypothetical protein